MGRKSKTLEDYRAMARENELTFLGEEAPLEVRHSTFWRCNRCGREMQKSYNNVKYQNACRCRADTLTEGDYMRLADNLGLLWEGDSIPQNVHTATHWRSLKLNVGFRASYGALAYGKIPKSLALYVQEADYVSYRPEAQPE
jgi:hypothetical protein